MSNTETRIRIGQAINIAYQLSTSILTNTKDLNVDVKDVIDTAEGLLPQIYNSIETMQKDQLARIENIPQEETKNVEHLEDKIKKLKTIEEVEQFKRVNKDFINTLDKVEIERLSKLIKI